MILENHKDAEEIKSIILSLYLYKKPKITLVKGENIDTSDGLILSHVTSEKAITKAITG